MKLAQVTVGQVVTIQRIGGEPSFRRRLMELGLLPGTRVQVMGVAPLGDPLELLVRGSSLSIRRNEASAILVTGEPTRAPEAEHGSVERELEQSAIGLAGPS
jgi:ferrous iron transport protein A